MDVKREELVIVDDNSIQQVQKKGNFWIERIKALDERESLF